MIVGIIIVITYILYFYYYFIISSCAILAKIRGEFIWKLFKRHSLPSFI